MRESTVSHSRAFMTSTNGAAAIRAIRRHSDLPILSHIGIQDNQKTNYGHDLSQYVRECEELGVDVIGLAGDVGPSGMLTALETLRPLTKKPISLRPNAGFSALRERSIYLFVQPRLSRQICQALRASGCKYYRRPRRCARSPHQSGGQIRFA